MWVAPKPQPEWQKEIAKRLGLESAYRPTGRPPKVGRNQNASPGEDRSDVGWAGQFNSIGPVPLSRSAVATHAFVARPRSGFPLGCRVDLGPEQLYHKAGGLCDDNFPARPRGRNQT